MIDMDVISNISEKLSHEFFDSINKHDALFNTAHEGYAVIKEELEELWDGIKKDDWKNIEEEAVQVGAMAMKLLYSLPVILEKYKKNAQGRTDNLTGKLPFKDGVPND